MKCKKRIILTIITCILLLSGCEKGEMRATAMVLLPDVEMGEEGKGFTCTGLVYDKNEEVFYVGNIGKSLPEVEKFKSTIVKLSKDFKKNLGEIKLYQTFDNMEDIQGLTIDYTDNSIWFCSWAENKIRHIDKNGRDLGYIPFDNPSGIVYDSRDNSLYILSSTALTQISKDGDILNSIGIELTGQDQLWLDEKYNTIYVTAGNDYNRANYVYTIELDTGKINKKYILLDSYAIEGIYLQDNEMYILNDGYYHGASIPINQVNIYAI